MTTAGLTVLLSVLSVSADTTSVQQDSLPVSSGTPLTLQECLRAGLQGNLDLQRTEVGSEKTRAQLEEAKRNYYPTLVASSTFQNMWDKPVMYGAEQGSTWSLTGGLTLTQALYVPQALTGIKMANKSLELENTSKQALREGTIQQLAVLYWSAVYIEESQTTLAKSHENLVRVKETVKSMMENGIAKKSDLNSMDISLATLDANIEKIQDQVKSQKASLLQAMGRDPNEQIVLVDRLSVDTRATNNKSGDPEKSSLTLKLLDQQIELKEMQTAMTGQSRLPTVAAFASYSTTGSSENLDFFDTSKFTDTGVWGIKASVPIFDGLVSNAKQAQNRIEKRQLQIDRSKQIIALKKDTENARRAFVTAQSQVDRQISTTKLAEETFTMKEQEYQNQVCSLRDLITADNSLVEARANLTAALYAEKTAELELERILGLLLQRAQ